MIQRPGARQGSLGSCHMGDKHTSILLKALLFWASSETECLLTNPEGQAAKSAQMFPSARQDAILVTCQENLSVCTCWVCAGPFACRRLHTLWSALWGRKNHAGFDQLFTKSL